MAQHHIAQDLKPGMTLPGENIHIMPTNLHPLRWTNGNQMMTIYSRCQAVRADQGAAPVIPRHSRAPSHWDRPKILSALKAVANATSSAGFFINAAIISTMAGSEHGSLRWKVQYRCRKFRDLQQQETINIWKQFKLKTVSQFVTLNTNNFLTVKHIYFNPCTMHLLLFCTMTNKCTINLIFVVPCIVLL